MLVVESAKPSEVHEVLRLADESRLGVDLQSFAHACTHETCMVARESRSGRMLGFVVAAHQEPCEGHIMAIAVDSLHRGEGVGSALLAGVRDAMARAGAMRLSLEVRIDNRVACDFYARHGFAPEGLQHRAYPDGQDAVRYGKPI